MKPGFHHAELCVATLLVLGTVTAAFAQGTLPGETPEIRRMALATAAEGSVRGCPTTFQIRPKLVAEHAALLRAAMERYPKSFDEMVNMTASHGGDQRNCIRAATVIFCSENEPFLELKEPARKALSRGGRCQNGRFEATPE